MLQKLFNIKISISYLIKFLFYTFPLFMLMPSGYITAYVTLLTAATLIFFYSNSIKIKFDFIDYFVCIFFISSLISTLVNIKTLGFFLFFKSILDLRFIVFFIIIRNLIKSKFIDPKIFAFFALISTSFLSIDIIYQHINGQDFFGNKPFDGRFNGIFEHEAVAGSYIQKFSLISFLFIVLSNLNYKFIFITIFINLLGIGILLSLDRMPFLIYLFILIILIIFLNKRRSLLISNLLIILLIFTLLFKNYDPIKNRYESLNHEINFSKINIFFQDNNHIDKEIKVIDQNIFIGDYSKIYKSVYYLWLEKPILGSGVKSFQVNCHKLLINKKDITCSTHPHNIYLEVITNQGLAGLLIFISLIILIINNFVKELSTENHKNKKIINLIFLSVLIAELWPIRSYGSIFHTVNGSIFWYLMALCSSIKYIKKK